jgi:hypothetical protein
VVVDDEGAEVTCDRLRTTLEFVALLEEALLSFHVAFGEPGIVWSFFQ